MSMNNEKLYEFMTKMHSEMQEGFEKVYANMQEGFKNVYADMQEGFKKVDKRFDALETRVDRIEKLYLKSNMTMVKSCRLSLTATNSIQTSLSV